MPSHQSRVVVVKTNRPFESVASSGPLQEMIERGLMELTGSPDMTAAWSRYFKPGETIGIKVNCLAGKRMSTRPEVALALGLRAIFEGYNPAERLPDADALREHYQALSQRSGMTMEPPGALLFDVGFDLVGVPRTTNVERRSAVAVAGRGAADGVGLTHILGPLGRRLPVRPVLRRISSAAQRFVAFVLVFEVSVNRFDVQVRVGNAIAHTGATTVSGGTLALENTSSFASDITNNAALQLGGTVSWGLGNTIGGAGTPARSTRDTTGIAAKVHSGETSPRQEALRLGGRADVAAVLDGLPVPDGLVEGLLLVDVDGLGERDLRAGQPALRSGEAGVGPFGPGSGLQGTDYSQHAGGREARHELRSLPDLFLDLLREQQRAAFTGREFLQPVQRTRRDASADRDCDIHR